MILILLKINPLFQTIEVFTDIKTVGLMSIDV